MSSIAREFVKRFGLTVLLMVPLFAYVGLRFAVFAASPFDKGPWVTWAHERLDPATSVQVRWETSEPGGTDLWLAAAPGGPFAPVAYGGPPVRLHVVTLQGLTPGTKYYYRVGDPGGKIHQFSTAPVTTVPFNFTVVSDTQSLWGTGHFDRVTRALGRAGDVAFTAVLGDLVQDGDYQRDWNFFFSRGSRFLSKAGFVPLPGNHDERGGWEAASLYPRYFNYSNDARRLYYAFNWSNVLFVAMEVAVGANSDLSADPEQLAWLEGVLSAAADKDFRVVAFHRNVYTVEPEGDNDALIRTLLPVLDAHDVQLVMYGHHHCYMRFDDGNRTYVCTGGGAGMLDEAHVTHRYVQRFANVPNYLHVFVDGGTMEVRAVTPDGVTIDSVTLTSNTGGGA
ncbi:MAG: hypothetical protein Kow0069_28670 [Promethearchaeota archaeon]